MSEIMGLIVVSILAAATAVLAWGLILFLIGLAPEMSRWRSPEPIAWTLEEMAMFKALLYAIRCREEAGYNVSSDVVLLNRDKYSRIIRAINDNCPSEQYLIAGIRAILSDNTNDWRLVPRAKIFELEG